MKHKLVTFVLAVLGLAAEVSAQTTVPTTTYSSSQPVVVSDNSTISTGSNAVTVASVATVTYRAGTSVTLWPGFHAAGGSNFFASIGSLVDTDGDGIPDAWEKAHGLDPNNPADAQNTTTGGLTYLLEYLLGTRTTTTKQSDTGNTTALKVHRPTQ